MMLVVSIFAIIGAFVVGVLSGATVSSYYHSKKECRECRRRVVRYGFNVDGKEYMAQEVKGGKA